ncbi:MAG: hypothetical protein WAS73_12270 [Defluviicoccus sp.]
MDITLITGPTTTNAPEAIASRAAACAPSSVLWSSMGSISTGWPVPSAFASSMAMRAPFRAGFPAVLPNPVSETATASFNVSAAVDAAGRIRAALRHRSHISRVATGGPGGSRRGRGSSIGRSIVRG